jgi:NAD(P)-dependent dehydrogenase (short-subunit alcohol dehydrogenase family)
VHGAHPEVHHVNEPTPELVGLPPGGFRLDGRRAVVTGASRNIGANIALAFAQSGADVVLVARGSERLEEVAAEIKQAVPERAVIPVVADVADPGAAATIAAAARDAIGTIDVLVNNAADSGNTSSQPSLELDDEVFERVFQTNVLGPFRLIRELAPAMVDCEHGGSIINLLSGAGFQPVPRTLPYGTSKAGLWLMTRSLATELAPHVRVNALVPGIVSETGEPRSEGARRIVETVVPFKRAGSPDELTGAAVYLASSVSSYTSGTVIFCNGARPW